MERTWKPTTAGILCILAGAMQLIWGITIAVFGGTIAALIGIPWTGAFGIPSIVLGIVAILGGIYALRRRIWGLALAGSICALFIPSIVFGTLAIIFVSLGKVEFE